MTARVYFVAFLLLIAPFAAFGQTGLGTITGTVVDASGASIPGATIKVVQVSTNSQRTTTSNEVGLFTVPSLLPSEYTITITATGFKEKLLEKLQLSAFQILTLGNLSMEVGSGPAVAIDVTAEAVQLATESAVRDNTVVSKQVTDMPALGRNWVTMLRVIPGALSQMMETRKFTLPTVTEAESSTRPRYARVVPVPAVRIARG